MVLTNYCYAVKNRTQIRSSCTRIFNCTLLLNHFTRPKLKPLIISTILCWCTIYYDYLSLCPYYLNFYKIHTFSFLINNVFCRFLSIVFIFSIYRIGYSIFALNYMCIQWVYYYYLDKLNVISYHLLFCNMTHIFNNFNAIVNSLYFLLFISKFNTIKSAGS